MSIEAEDLDDHFGDISMPEGVKMKRAKKGYGWSPPVFEEDQHEVYDNFVEAVINAEAAYCHSPVMHQL